METKNNGRYTHTTGSQSRVEAGGSNYICGLDPATPGLRDISVSTPPGERRSKDGNERSGAARFTAGRQIRKVAWSFGLCSDLLLLLLLLLIGCGSSTATAQTPTPSSTPPQGQCPHPTGPLLDLRDFVVAPAAENEDPVLVVPFTTLPTSPHVTIANEVYCYDQEFPTGVFACVPNEWPVEPSGAPDGSELRAICLGFSPELDALVINRHNFQQLTYTVSVLVRQVFPTCSP